MTLGRLGLSDHRTDQLQKIFQTLPESSGQSTAHGPAPPRCCCADRSTNPTIQTKAIATSRPTDRPTVGDDHDDFTHSTFGVMLLHTVHAHNKGRYRYAAAMAWLVQNRKARRNSPKRAQSAQSVRESNDRAADDGGDRDDRRT